MNVPPPVQPPKASATSTFVLVGLVTLVFIVGFGLGFVTGTTRESIAQDNTYLASAPTAHKPLTNDLAMLSMDCYKYAAEADHQLDKPHRFQNGLDEILKNLQSVAIDERIKLNPYIAFVNEAADPALGNCQCDIVETAAMLDYVLGIRDTLNKVYEKPAIDEALTQRLKTATPYIYGSGTLIRPKDEIDHLHKMYNLYFTGLQLEFFRGKVPDEDYKKIEIFFQEGVRNALTLNWGQVDNNGILLVDGKPLNTFTEKEIIVSMSVLAHRLVALEYVRTGDLAMAYPPFHF